MAAAAPAGSGQVAVVLAGVAPVDAVARLTPATKLAPAGTHVWPLLEDHPAVAVDGDVDRAVATELASVEIDLHDLGVATDGAPVVEPEVGRRAEDQDELQLPGVWRRVGKVARSLPGLRRLE